MAKKALPEDIEIIRRHRAESQMKAQAEEQARHKKAQERRDALAKERKLRSNTPNIKKKKSLKKKVAKPSKNLIDPNKVLDVIECGIPFTVENIAQRLILDFSKGSPNRIFLAEIFDQFLTAGILQTDERGRFIKPFQPDFHDKDTSVGVVIKRDGISYFKPSKDEGKLSKIENCLIANDTIVTVTPSTSLNGYVRILAEHDGDINEAEGLSTLTALEFGIPTEFSQEALDELIGMETPSASIFRKDYTHKRYKFTTIDPETAKDKDDATYVEPLKKGDGFRIMVAVADVAYYVRPGSALWNEAYNRGNTTYLPGRTIPMYPEILSNGLCSLNSGEVKAVIVQTIDIDMDGNIIKEKTEQAIIKVYAGLNYDQVQDAIGGKASPAMNSLYEKILIHAKNATDALRKESERRGCLDLDVPEQRIDFSRDTGVNISEERNTTSHQMIALQMIAANRGVGSRLEKLGKTIFSRAHGTPVEKAYEAYVGDLEKLGIKPDKDLELPDRVRDMVKQSYKLPHRKGQKARSMIIRMQDRAKYVAKKSAHYGLGLMDGGYVHFTSPIRRFADMVVHAMLNGYEKHDEAFFQQENLEKVAKHISMTERRSADAERKVRERLLAKWVEGNMSRTFNARVVDIDPETNEIELRVLDKSIHTYIEADPKAYKLDEIVQIVPVKADKITGVVHFKVASNANKAGNDNSKTCDADAGRSHADVSTSSGKSKHPRMQDTRYRFRVS